MRWYSTFSSSFIYVPVLQKVICPSFKPAQLCLALQLRPARTCPWVDAGGSLMEVIPIAPAGPTTPEPRSLTSLSLCFCQAMGAESASKSLPLGCLWLPSGPQPCIPPSPTRGILASGYANKGWLLPDSPEDDESHDIFFHILHKITKLNPSMFHSEKTFHLHSCMHLNPVNNWWQWPNEPHVSTNTSAQHRVAETRRSEVRTLVPEINVPVTPKFLRWGNRTFWRKILVEPHLLEIYFNKTQAATLVDSLAGYSLPSQIPSTCFSFF